jgi:alkylation response protein AidB-like acyl-CoA dehydrogenase
MTGRALFNEVFFTDARVADAGRIGARGHGWKVANITLGHERAGLGSGGGGAGESAIPGTDAGNWPKRAGDLAPKPRGDKPSGGGRRRSPMASGAGMLIGVAKANGTITDPTVRQGLMKLHTLNEIGKYNAERSKATRASTGKDIPGIGNIAKLSMSEILRLTRDLGLAILGPYGTLHAYDDADRDTLDKATGNPFIAGITEMALFAQGPAIYGGTDQIQHNIIGERVLGLPKEPNNDKTLPFSQLPKNA